MRGFEGALARMLRNEAIWFMRLGSMIERGDNTARLLDVKYYLLLPAGRGGRRRARPRPMDDHPPDRLRPRPPIAASIREALQALAGRRPADLPPRAAALARRGGRGDGRSALPMFADRTGRQGEADRLARRRLTGSQALDVETIDAAAACTNGCTLTSPTMRRSTRRSPRQFRFG